MFSAFAGNTLSVGGRGFGVTTGLPDSTNWVRNSNHIIETKGEGGLGKEWGKGWGGQQSWKQLLNNNLCFFVSIISI